MIHENARGDEHLKMLAPKVECLSSLVPKSLTIKEGEGEQIFGSLLSVMVAENWDPKGSIYTANW